MVSQLTNSYGHEKMIYQSKNIFNLSKNFSLKYIKTPQGYFF